MPEINVIKKFSLLKGLQLHDAYCWILTAYRNLQQLRCDGFLSLQRMMESKVFRCALAGGNWIDRALLTLLLYYGETDQNLKKWPILIKS